MDVICPACGHGLRTPRVRPAEEERKAAELRADLARQCAENRINGVLSCPMALEEKQTEKVA